jgi:hypothetical protein
MRQTGDSTTAAPAGAAGKGAGGGELNNNRKKDKKLSITNPFLKMTDRCPERFYTPPQHLSVKDKLF